MKKITLTLLAFFVTCCLWQVNAQTTICGNAPELIPAGAALPTPSSGLMNPSIATNADAGLVGTHYTIENVTLNIEHTWASDIEATLISPSGTTLDLMFDDGGSDGLDVAADVVFTDTSVNDPEDWDTGDPLPADFFPEGGLLNTVFDGEPVSGDWTLQINDDAGGDIGQLNSFCVTFAPIVFAVNECGNAPELIPAGAALPTPSSGLMNPSIANVADSGVIGINATLDQVTLNIEHTWASDIEATLISPAGTTLDLMFDDGGSDGLDVAADVVFTDSSTNDPEDWDTGDPLPADFFPEGGLFNTVFDGEDINGAWTLQINDDAGGDIGQLNSFCIDFSYTAPLGDPPMMTCPMDVTTTASTGVCGAVVAFPPPLVTDPDGDLDTVVQTMGPASGSEFPVGSTVVEFTATDLAGNTATCSFTVTVTDDEAPMAVCMDITVQLDANGEYVLTPTEIDGGSTDNCGIASLEVGVPNPIVSGLYAVYPWDSVDNVARYDYDPMTDAISLVDNPFSGTGLDTNYAVDINPVDGMAYILGDSPTTGNRALFAFDMTTGTAGAELGDVVSAGGAGNPNSMAFGNDGTLYVSYGGGDLDTLDLGTMTSTAFATVPSLGGAGLTFDSDGNRVIYANNFGTVDVLEISTAGVVSPLFSFATVDGGCGGTAQAMEYVGGGKIVASTTFGCSTIYTIDLTAGTATALLSPDGFQDNIKSLVYVAPSLAGAPDLLLTCADVGTHTITLLVTDDSGNQSTCDAMVTVEDVTAPVITCIGEPAVFSYLQEFESSSLPMNWSTQIDAGVWDWTFGSGDLPTGDDFATNAAIFDDDAAGIGEINVATL
ncbi:proprotein convertase P-domain-containing protein, partial [Aureisphaera sp.]